MSTDDLPEDQSRPPALVGAVAIAVFEALAIAAYAVSIAVAALGTPGSIAAAPVEVVLYLVFAAGILVVAGALWRGRAAARTPFVVAQLFGLVTGWTLTQGDGDLVHRIGYVVLGVSVVGIALAMSPAVGESLDT